MLWVGSNADGAPIRCCWLRRIWPVSARFIVWRGTGHRRLAYETETIAPGCQDCWARQRPLLWRGLPAQVFGTVGIDDDCGTSRGFWWWMAMKRECGIWVAADLLAQAEHDTSAQSSSSLTCRHLAEAFGTPRSETQLKTLRVERLAAPVGVIWRRSFRLLM